MILKVLNSNSNGNCYLFTAENGEILMVECGLNFNIIKQTLKFNLSNIAGCILTHEHGDHSKGIKAAVQCGVNVYSSKGTFDALKIKSHRFNEVVNKKIFNVGSFKIMPFDVVHDAAEPFGYLINHKECGNVLFITDTSYLKYKFKNINNILIEANYSEKILETKSGYGGKLPSFLAQRIINSHLSLETCNEILKNMDLSEVNRIVLLHLSNSNSDEKHFKIHTENMTGKEIHIADAGLSISMNLTPI